MRSATAATSTTPWRGGASRSSRPPDSAASGSSTSCATWCSCAPTQGHDSAGLQLAVAAQPAAPAGGSRRRRPGCPLPLKRVSPSPPPPPTSPPSPLSLAGTAPPQRHCGPVVRDAATSEGGLAPLSQDTVEPARARKTYGGLPSGGAQTMSTRGCGSADAAAGTSRLTTEARLQSPGGPARPGRRTRADRRRAAPATSSPVSAPRRNGRRRTIPARTGSAVGAGGSPTARNVGPPCPTGREVPVAGIKHSTTAPGSTSSAADSCSTRRWCPARTGAAHLDLVGAPQTVVTDVRLHTEQRVQVP